MDGNDSTTPTDPERTRSNRYKPHRPPRLIYRNRTPLLPASENSTHPARQRQLQGQVSRSRAKTMSDYVIETAPSAMPFIDDAIVWASPATPLKADLVKLSGELAMPWSDDVMVSAARVQPVSKDVTVSASLTKLNDDVVVPASSPEPSGGDVMTSASRAKPTSNDVMVSASSATPFLLDRSTESCSSDSSLSSAHVDGPVCSSPEEQSPPATVKFSLNVNSMPWEPSNSKSWRPRSADSPTPREPHGNPVPQEMNNNPMLQEPREMNNNPMLQEPHDNRARKLCDFLYLLCSFGFGPIWEPCDFTACATVENCLFKVLDEDTPIESIGDSLLYEPDDNSTPKKLTAKPKRVTSSQMLSAPPADGPLSLFPSGSSRTQQPLLCAVPAFFSSPQSPASPEGAESPPLTQRRQVSSTKEPRARTLFTNHSVTFSTEDDSGFPSPTDQEDCSAGDEEDTATPGSLPDDTSIHVQVETEGSEGSPTVLSMLQDLQERHLKLERTCASLHEDVTGTLADKVAGLCTNKTDQDLESTRLTDRLVRELGERLDQEVVRRVERVEDSIHRKMNAPFGELNKGLRDARRATHSEIKDMDLQLKGAVKQLEGRTAFLETELKSLRDSFASSRSDREHVTRSVEQITLYVQKAEQGLNTNLQLSQRTIAKAFTKHGAFCNREISSLVERLHQLETKVKAEDKSISRAWKMSRRLDRQKQLTEKTLARLKERAAKVTMASGKLTRDTERAESVLLNVGSETTEARKLSKSLTDKLDGVLEALANVEENLAGKDRKWTDLDRNMKESLSVFTKLETEVQQTEKGLRKRHGILTGMSRQPRRSGSIHSVTMETLDPTLRKQLLSVLSTHEYLIETMANLEKSSEHLIRTDKKVRGELEQGLSNLDKEFHAFQDLMENKRKVMIKGVDDLRQTVTDTYYNVKRQMTEMKASK